MFVGGIGKINLRPGAASFDSMHRCIIVRSLAITVVITGLSAAVLLAFCLGKSDAVLIPTKPTVSYLMIAFMLASSLLIGAGAGVASYYAARGIISDLCSKISSMKMLGQDITHELSAPLGSIVSRVQLLQRDSEHSNVTGQLALLSEAANRALTLVGDYRALSTYEETTQGQFSIIRLDHLVTQCVREMTPLFEARNMRIEVPHLDPAGIAGNREGIKRLITNLLSNGLRYGAKGGAVAVSLSRERKYLRLTVKDDGVGIPSEEMENLFVRFYRGTNSVGKSNSTGLGLAIVKSVVDAHAGKIDVTSKLGCGTQFDVLLPVISDKNFVALPALLDRNFSFGPSAKH